MGLKSKGETVEEIAGIVKGISEIHCRLKRNFRMFWIIVEQAVMVHQALILARPPLLLLQVQEFQLLNMEIRSISSKTGSADVLEELRN